MDINLYSILIYPTYLNAMYTSAHIHLLYLTSYPLYILPYTLTTDIYEYVCDSYLYALYIYAYNVYVYSYTLLYIHTPCTLSLTILIVSKKCYTVPTVLS